MDFTYPRNMVPAMENVHKAVIVAPLATLRGGWHARELPSAIAERVELLVSSVDAVGRSAKVLESIAADSPRSLTLVVLPDQVSRHNTPTRADAVYGAMRGISLPRGGAVVAVLDEPDHCAAVLAAVARSFPRYSLKTSPRPSGGLSFMARRRDGGTVTVSARHRELVTAVQWAARMTDTPAQFLQAGAFAREIRSFVKPLTGVKVKEIKGDALLKASLGGIHGVGRAATEAPRLIILEYKPPKAKRKVALVGKGVVFDSGGLNLKKAKMDGMKADMGGAAAVIGAFRAAVATKPNVHLFALAGLVENSIGPHAYRPGDVLTMHSGKTVEINNTDAEGRLVLADAASYAARVLKVDAIVDAATLTGAQKTTSGDRHAVVVSNRAALESLASQCGMETGDMVWAMPFAPEFYQAEFDSRIADMKNSVKNRANAQVSCAAQFIYSHIANLDPPWLHIDMSGPARRFERGTGYGVSLMASMVDGLHRLDLSE